MELYIYFQFGPASVGGSVSPCFLESAAAIQKAMKAGECSNREELRKRNNKELLDKAHTKKAMKLLANTVEEMEECDPTTRGQGRTAPTAPWRQGEGQVPG